MSDIVLNYDGTLTIRGKIKSSIIVEVAYQVGPSSLAWIAAIIYQHSSHFFVVLMYQYRLSLFVEELSQIDSGA
jgi:hypothetical protein